MELVLSGNLLMLKPWLPQLSGELSFWRRDYNPTMKTKMTEERMYFTHTVEGVEVGYVPKDC